MTEKIVRCPGIVQRLAVKTDVANRVQGVAPGPVRIIDAAIIVVDPVRNQQIVLAETNTTTDDAVIPVQKIVIAVHRENELVAAEVAVDRMGRRKGTNPTETIRSEDRTKMTLKCLHRKTGTARRSSDGQTINSMRTIDPVHRIHSIAINATRRTTAMEGISMMVAANAEVDRDVVWATIVKRNSSTDRSKTTCWTRDGRNVK